MEPVFIATMIEPKNGSQDFQTYLLNQRIRTLKSALGLADIRLKKMDQSLFSGPFRGIYLAPEYFFSRTVTGGLPGSERHLNESDKREVEKNLTNLSKQYPEWLIIAGSIAWQKPLIRDDTIVNDEGYRNSKIERGIGNQYTFDNYLRHIEKHDIRHESRSQKVYIPPEAAAQRDWALMTRLNEVDHRDTDNFVPLNTYSAKIKRLGNPHLEATKGISYDILKDKFKKRLNGDRINFLARNTALIFLGGERVYKYHKASDFQEVLSFKQQAVFAQGKMAGVFPCGQYHIGIEICLDHSTGVLNELHKNKDLDIHIILSDATFKFDSYLMIKPNGIAIHSSTNAAAEGVFRLVGGSVVEVPRLEQNRINNYYLFRN